MKLDTSQAGNLVNIPYAVMFGLIFSFSFTLVTRPEYDVTLAVSFDNVILWVILLIYYVLVWIGHNLLLNNVTASTTIIFLWSFSAWYLGATVIFTNSIGLSKYLFIGLYVMSMGIYDFIDTRTNFYKAIVPESVIWFIISAYSLVTGFFLAMTSFFSLITGNTSYEVYLKKIGLIVLCIFVPVRLIRLAYLIKGGRSL